MKHDTRWSRAHRPARHLPLSSDLAGATCAALVPVASDPGVGEEVVVALLAVTEEEARHLAATEPFRVGVVAGLIPTGHGPVLGVLWTVADPAGGWEPLVVHQSLLDPADATALAPFRRLAAQSCWHLAVLGPDHVVHRWAALDNHFGLGESLEACVELGRALGPTDIAAAARAIERRWTPLDVLAAHDPPPVAAGRFLVDDLVALLAHALTQRDRTAARAVGAVASARGGMAAMELVLATYRARLGGARGADPDRLSRWWRGVGGWRE
ncbi:MAG: hypothetical protein CVU56_11650 [Deltaproteobacteria bacterium HGW-Deltaproteobacteria-14]|jgi:hypothetical protein|nr:MAG: hypothetical protein CVU56_11650 [Deltaproteobacteria bacterium HGW-Deltaproteobacteria-14]